MSQGFVRLLLDTRSARREGPGAIARRQRARLAEMVALARAHSTYLRELYQKVPERVEDPILLPITRKKELMARFDDWVTDREVTHEEIRRFVDNPDLIGERFLGKYTVATTSGTTGTRGIFVIDHQSMAVTNALMLRMLGDWLEARDLVRILSDGGRTAILMATGGHFASAVAAARLTKGNGWQRKIVGIFPVQTPLPDLVAELNRFRPVVVAPYASTAVLLAGEQETGRLHIDPVLLVLSAEGLAPGEYERIARVFDAKVRDSYAATECPFLSYRCEHGWLHVNSDWVVLEPVDADYRPVRPGTQSHTVLVSNLANRVQPILRYDLGDSVVERPDPCPCGNPLPAIRVQGRSADVLTFRTGGEPSVTVAPLVFGTLLERIAGIELFQIAQTSATCLRVRLRFAAGADPERVWLAVASEIASLLAAHGLGHVEVERAPEPPEQSPGGKFRQVIPLT